MIKQCIYIFRSRFKENTLFLCEMDRRKKKKKKFLGHIQWKISKVSSYTAPPASLTRWECEDIAWIQRSRDRAREEKPWCWTNIVSPRVHPLIRRLGHVRGHVGPREDILHRNHHQLRGAPSYDVRASWNRNAFFSFTRSRLVHPIQASLSLFFLDMKGEEAKKLVHVRRSYARDLLRGFI